LVIFVIFLNMLGLDFTKLLSQEIILVIVMFSLIVFLMIALSNAEFSVN